MTRAGRRRPPPPTAALPPRAANEADRLHEEAHVRHRHGRHQGHSRFSRLPLSSPTPPCPSPLPRAVPRSSSQSRTSTSRSRGPHPPPRAPSPQMDGDGNGEPTDGSEQPGEGGGGVSPSAAAGTPPPPRKSIFQKAAHLAHLDKIDVGETVLRNTVAPYLEHIIKGFELRNLNKVVLKRRHSLSRPPPFAPPREPTHGGVIAMPRRPRAPLPVCRRAPTPTTTHRWTRATSIIVRSPARTRRRPRPPVSDRLRVSTSTSARARDGGLGAQSHPPPLSHTSSFAPARRQSGARTVVAPGSDDTVRARRLACAIDHNPSQCQHIHFGAGGFTLEPFEVRGRLTVTLSGEATRSLCDRHTAISTTLEPFGGRPAHARRDGYF